MSAASQDKNRNREVPEMPITRHLILEKAMKSWTILAAALAIVLALQSPNGAVARDMGFRLPPNTKLPAPPAEGYRLVSMRFDVPTCLGLAEEAVKHTRVDNGNFSASRKGGSMSVATSATRGETLSASSSPRQVLAMAMARPQ